VGLIARGAVYFLMGILALLVVLKEPGGRTTDTRGAMRELLHEPMGYLLLTLIGVGLLSYSAWRLLEGINDYDEYGRGFRGFFVRSGQIAGSLVHLALGLYAINLVFLFTRTNTRAGEQHLVRWLFGLPSGDVIVLGVGLGVVIFGIAQIILAWREGFRHYIVLPEKRSGWMLPLCKYGLVARGVVFTFIGWFFVNAAVKHSPREAGGFKEAWAALRAQPHGDVLVGVVAIGFMAYGFFSVIEARYRRP
jgi:hypothetical protein